MGVERRYHEPGAGSHDDHIYLGSREARVCERAFRGLCAEALRLPNVEVVSCLKPGVIYYGGGCLDEVALSYP